MALTLAQSSIANTNNSPTLTLTTTTTLTNSAAPVVKVFKNVNVGGGSYNGVLDTGSSSIIKQIVIKVTGAINFANEKLTIDGFDIPLFKTTVDGQFPTGGSLTNGSSYSVVQIGSVTTVTLKNLNLLTLGDTNQANTLMESILYKNADPAPTDGNRSITMVSMTDGGVVGTINNGYLGQNFSSFNPALMTSTVTIDRTAPNAPIVSIPENDGVGVTNAEGQDGTSVVVSLAGTGAREGDVVTLTVKDLAPIKYTLLSADIDSNSLSMTISSATLQSLGSGSVPVKVTITDAAQNTSVVSAVNVNLVNVNTAPSGTSSTVTMLEDNSRTFSASDFGFSDVASSFFYGNGGVNTLSAVIITALPTVGTLTLNNVNVIQNQRIPAASLSDLKYTPALNGNGQNYASIGFKVQDNGGTSNGGSDTSAASTLTINVTPVNDAPTLVNQIPNQMAVFNSPFEYTIPANTFADVDSSTLTYSATRDDGSALPAWLSFDAATGKFTGTPKSTATVNVKVTASDGALNASNTFQIDLAPVVNSVALTSAVGIQNNRLNAGDVLSASVTFSELVNVTGTPQLALTIGGNMVKANYVSGSGTTVLTFNYTILANQNDADGICIDANALSLNAGTIKDVTGNNAILATTSAMDNTSYMVDNVMPLWVASNPSDNGYLMDIAGNLMLTFNEGVSKGTGTIQLFNAANTLIESFDVATSSRITGWNGKTLTIDPTTSLTANTGYYVKIAPSAINDLAGNAYAGISDATTFNFTTADASGSISAPSYSGVGGAVRMGQSLSSIGDFNGDGYDDVLIGDSGEYSSYGTINSGAFYVVYGNSTGTLPNLMRGTIAASQGFKVVGGVCHGLGISVSGAGDTNGDGYQDILVGTVNYGVLYPSENAFVLYGSSNAQAMYGSGFDMGNDYVPSSMGFKITHPGPPSSSSGYVGGIFGSSVSQLGDVNGDGLSDLAVTQHTSYGSTVGTYVMYGKTSGANYYVNMGSISPNEGFLVGEAGTRVSGAGDVNGDGLADMVVGTDANSAFVVYGNSINSGVSLSSGTIASSRGFKIVGPTYSQIGLAVSSAGDVNGDGLADVVVGGQSTGAASYYGSNGTVYVVYGNSTGNTVDFKTGTIAASQGYTITASNASMSLGYAVSSAGDMNGDGLTDLIVSASGTNSVYVVYGNATGTNMTLGASISPSQGFMVKGPVGTAVSSAGDVNGDGLADLLLGPASGTIGYSLILGGTQWTTSAVNGIGLIDGTSADEAIIGSAGNDTLTGGGGVDRFFAGKGDDTVVLTASDIKNLASNTGGQTVKAVVNGGNGFDTIQLSGGANLDLTTISNAASMSAEETSRIDNIERVDLATDTAANMLKLHTKDVNDMAGMNVFHTGTVSADGKMWTNVTGTPLSAMTTKHQMLVDAGLNDSVSLNASNGAWRTVGTVNNGASNYTVYEDSNTASQVLVKSGVAVQNTGAPLLISSNPTDSGYLMGLGNNITLTFDQVIQQGIGTIQLWNGTTGAFVESFDVTSSALVTGWSGTTLTINPTADLAPDTNYFIKIGDAAVKNAAGNTFTGIDLGTTMDFTTVNAAGSIVVKTPSTWKNLSNDVANIGDVNGDGFDDIVIGAYAEYNTFEGAAYVVYGNASGTVPALSGGSIAANLGFKLIGGLSSSFGYSVSGVGDINGDGLADMMIGANTNGSTYTGYGAYIIYGRTAFGGAYLGLGIDPSIGFKITASYYLGQSVSGAGDVNGDGLVDFLVSEYKPDGYGALAGSAYVVYGNSTGTGYDLGTGQVASSKGFKISGASVMSLGYSASGAGDFNGDGLSDVVVSARTYGGQNQGAAYVIYGNSTGTGVSLDASNGIAASQGFRISGQINTNLGESVSSAGDVNGDGLADVMVSSKTAGVGGSVYVLYGTSAGNGLDIDLNTSGGTIAASRGFVISDAQVGASLGYRMASAGDVNGDGLSDMIVSAPNGYNSSTYIVYGNASGTGVVIDSNGLIASSQGFRLTGSVGTGVSGAGDINGDGLADLVVGANPAANDYRYGVILGGTQWMSSVVDGIGIVNGTAGSEALIGSTGNDTLTGGGGVDRFFAGMGNDTIVLTASDFTNLANNAADQTAKENINGGNGFDTIRVSGGANVDLMSISNAGAMGFEENSRIESIERIDLASDVAANKLTLAARDVKDMASFNAIHTGSVSADGNTWTNVMGTALSATTQYHQLVIDGTSADSVLLNTQVGQWSNAGTVSDGVSNYSVYQNNATTSQALIKSGVSVVITLTPTPSPVIPVVNTAAPVLISGNPSDNGYMMAVGNNMSLSFDQVVNKGKGAIQLWNGATNALVESFDVATSSLVTGWASNTLTINPTANLAVNSKYFIKIADSVIQNAVGATFVGIADATTYNFSTAAADGSISTTAYTGSVGSYLGFSVSSAGDVNADGYDDYILGSYGNKAYVVYGNAGGVGASLPNGTIASSLGFQITGTDTLGYSVSGAGDVNGDGFADLIVGTNTNTSVAYVVYGASTMPATVNVTGTNFSSANGFKITGQADSCLGWSVSSAGDVNGDGLTDLIVGSEGSNYDGDTFIVYGATNNTGVNLSNGTIAAATGFSVIGQNSVSFSSSVSSAGDVNGDGLADLVIGGMDKNVYVVYGKAKSSGVSVSATTIAPSNGFRIVTNQVDTTIGNTVSSAGDVNGDGLSDLVISGANAYVVYGNSTGSTVTIDTNGAIAPSSGFRIAGLANYAVSSAGDVNGDGLADVIVGKYATNGAVYVVYGNASGSSVTIDANGNIPVNNGFKVLGETSGSMGNVLSAAGDINGDGLGDLILGSFNPNGAYSVILGGTQWLTNAVSLTGTSASEAVMGSLGNDTLVGGGGVDRFFAGKGNDTIVLTSSDIINLTNNTIGQAAKENVNGGNGFDTIRLSGGANLNLTNISNTGAMGLEENSRIESIERIDLATDTLANLLTLAAKDVKDMAGFNAIHADSVSLDGKTWTNVTGTALSATTKYHQLVVDGTSADGVTLAADVGFWANAGTASNGTTNYTIYQNTGTNSQVLVSSDVVVMNNDAIPDVVLTGLVV